jgi:hypothetical protein
VLTIHLVQALLKSAPQIEVHMLLWNNPWLWWTEAAWLQQCVHITPLVIIYSIYCIRIWQCLLHEPPIPISFPIILLHSW